MMFAIHVKTGSTYDLSKSAIKWRQFSKYKFIIVTVCPYLPCLVTCVPLLHLPIPNPLCLGHMLSTFISFIKLASKVWCNSLCHAGPYITDPMVRDKVLSNLKGWQINFSAVMQLFGLVRVQHRVVR